MTASPNIKVPVMELPLRADARRADAEQLASSLDRLKLRDFLRSVSVSTSMSKSNASARAGISSRHQAPGQRLRLYTVRLEFFPDNNDAIVRAGLKFGDFVRVVKSQFAPKLIVGMVAKELRKDAVAMAAVQQSASAQATNPGGKKPAKKQKKPKVKLPTRSSETAEYAILKAKKKQMSSYDDDDDDDLDGEQEDADETKSMDVGGDGDDEEDEDTDDGTSFSNTNDFNNPFFGGVRSNAKGSWVEVVVQVPMTSKKLLVLNMAEKACDSVLLKSTKGITRCFVVEKNGQFSVQTYGVNFESVWQRAGALVDVNRIQANDIYAILKTYGVEAARQAIVSEIRSVFKVYGIKVDARHLGLLADYMTFEGGYRALNRIGMASSSSAWQQITFETSMNFLVDACLNGDVETLTSPSARIVMGRAAKSGTGMFDLRHPLH
eukprot:TRINITY_DN66324_c3_g2_i2.p1 TRINITY_DN66324_c3_g2~~TRINITY_DN66324_c3_g2_i2.p1  ORF type:complete len:436 (-),score=247.21 TRINITY_DN66324_c3_g2_i2:478-1785(-)